MRKTFGTTDGKKFLSAGLAHAHQVKLEELHGGGSLCDCGQQAMQMVLGGPKCHKCATTCPCGEASVTDAAHCVPMCRGCVSMQQAHEELEAEITDYLEYNYPG